MRVYEFAKQHNRPSKEVVDMLLAAGFAVKSHMSLLDDNALEFLNKNMIDQQKKSTHTKSPAKPIKPQVHHEAPAPDITALSQKEVSRGSEKSQDAYEPSASVSKSIHAEAHQVSEPKISLEKNKNTALPVIILEPMTVGDFAERAHKSISDVILQLLKRSILAAKNQVIKSDVVERLAQHYGLPVELPQKSSTPNKNQSLAPELSVSKRQTKEMQEWRHPVVVVVGHVDHGKTSLLDYIRKTRVASKEKGGITQHIGAYEAQTPHGNIVFIDTPGHEAFGKIRQRGVRVADIAILVIAADDGIMPQTVEAIKQIKAMNLLAVVAINKVDKVDPARLDVVKRQLAQYDLLTEDWGGDVVAVPISAKTGQGIDKLLEMVALQAEMMDLKTSTKVPAYGFILESKIERGRGITATVICQAGILKVGDFFACDNAAGRVTSIFDSTGATLQQVGPSVPVQVTGFDQQPLVGDAFKVIPKSDYKGAKDVAGAKKSSVQTSAVVQEDANNIMIKVDTDSSKEALFDAIVNLNKKLKKQFHIVYAAVGDVNESDVDRAYATHSSIITLHARIDPKSLLLAQQRRVEVHQFDIIYKLTEFLAEWSARESIEYVEMRKKIGTAEVLKVFDIKNVGVIAGSIVKDGRFVREGFVVIYRNARQIGEGKIDSLQREKKTVKEVHTGFECGFVIDGFTEFQPGDIVECYIIGSVAKE